MTIADTDGQRAAREIMGKHFLGLPEVEKHYRTVTPIERAALAEIPPAIMGAIQDENVRSDYILVADIGLSIVYVRSNQREREELEEADQMIWPLRQYYYALRGLMRLLLRMSALALEASVRLNPELRRSIDRGKDFEDRAEQACWRLIRRKLIPDSGRKSWQEQQDLVPDTDQISNARQLRYMTTLLFQVTGERLFERSTVRTTDVWLDGSRVCIGYFDGDKFKVFDWEDNLRVGDTGVVSSRKTL